MLWYLPRRQFNRIFLAVRMVVLVTLSDSRMILLGWDLLLSLRLVLLFFLLFFSFFLLSYLGIYPEILRSPFHLLCQILFLFMNCVGVRSSVVLIYTFSRDWKKTAHNEAKNVLITWKWRRDKTRTREAREEWGDRWIKWRQTKGLSLHKETAKLFLLFYCSLCLQ